MGSTFYIMVASTLKFIPILESAIMYAAPEVSSYSGRKAYVN
jgi:hypothetical protein